MKDKTIEIKPLENNNSTEIQTEETKTTEEKKTLHTPLLEKEAQHIMSKVIDIAVIYQSMMNLPDSSEIEKDSNFYIDELLRILMDHGIIRP